MANKKTEAKETSESNETAVRAQPVAGVQPVPASPAASAPSAVAPGREQTASEPKRLSKGGRKHLRRQKQAGEYKPSSRR